MTGEGGVAGEGKRVRVGAACAAHSCLRIARSVVGRGGAGGMLPQENFDMRVLLRLLETAIIYGNWSVTQTSHRMVVSPTPFPLESSPLPLVSYLDPQERRIWQI